MAHMHPNMIPIPPAVMDAAMNCSAAELRYTNSKHTIELLGKDEDIRRLRVDVHILEDDNDELHDQLHNEGSRSEAFQKLVDENLARAEGAEAALRDVEGELLVFRLEVQRLQAETQALRDATQDSNNLLAEKLALTRELSGLKPQVEHLQAQAANTELLLGEKLALQRHLAEAQCEAENAKRETQRAMAKRRNTVFEIAQEEQVDDLKKQLAKEKRARERAEEAAEQAQGEMNNDDVRRELAKEKKMRERAEEELEAARENTQVEDVRRDLLKEKKAKQRLGDQLENLQSELEQEKKAVARAAKKAEGNEGADEAAEELREQLVKEKKAHAQVEKKAERAADEWEAAKATLEDKLSQFRKKLRETKEELKSTKTELAASNTNAVAAAVAAAAAAAANPATAAAPVKKTGAAKATSKKRAATTVEKSAEDTALGTPGDGPATKRSRKASSAAGVGHKSTFSITPFLHKTSMLNVEEDNDASDGSDVRDSPAAKKRSAKSPLAPAASIKSNSQPRMGGQQQDMASKPSLAAVMEEDEPASQPKENVEHAKGRGNAMKIKVKTGDGPAAAKDRDGSKVKQKIRKSLADFKSFRNDEDDEPMVKQKNRKLGGTGKTLFDAEEEAAQAEGSKVGFGVRGLFGTTGYARLVAAKKGGLAKKSSGVGRSVLITAGDGSGFQFSPLKRSKKNLDDTLRG